MHRTLMTKQDKIGFVIALRRIETIPVLHKNLPMYNIIIVSSFYSCSPASISEYSRCIYATEKAQTETLAIPKKNVLKQKVAR